MNDPKQIAASYLAAWNEADGERRRTMLAANWAENVRYVDPMMSGAGRDGIANMIEGARARLPGHAFALRGTPDGHGDHVRFAWALAPENGVAVAGGTDIVRLDGEGHIVEVVGFLDGAA